MKVERFFFKTLWWKMEAADITVSNMVFIFFEEVNKKALLFLFFNFA